MNNRLVINKKIRNGFSLMELLAVIVILAILALILVPFIGNLIREAKINSAVVSAYGYVEAANNEIIARSTKGEFVDETVYDVIPNILNVKYEGKGPSTGWFNIYKSKVDEGEFCINGFDIKYEDGKAKYVKDGNICPSEGSTYTPDPLDENELRYLCTLEYENSNAFFNTTNGNTYLIKKADDLACLAKLTNAYGGFTNAKAIMVGDIDFMNKNTYYNQGNDKYGDINEDGTESDLYTELTTGKGFLPIKFGYYPTEFDGGWHKVKNLLINRPESTKVGFISEVSSGTATVKDIQFEGARITGGNYTGLIAYASSAYFGAISATNTIINGGDYTGGIFGYISYYNTSKPLYEFYFDGAVNGGQYVGGIGGYLYTAIKCGLVDANITGTTNVGGIAGYGYTSSSYKSTKGAILGGSITATNGTAAYTVPGNDSNYSLYYYDNALTISGSTVDKKAGSLNMNYHYVSALDDVLDTIYGGDDDGSGYIYDYNENNKLILMKFDASKYPSTLRGSGTESDPYLLSTEKDFRDAALLLKGDYYFKIADNIDVSSFDYFYTLGTYNNYFTGHLDGNNKTITNIDINYGLSGGVVGYLNGGDIKNLTVTDVNVNELIDYNDDLNAFGVIAGYVKDGSITNVSVKDIVISNLTKTRYYYYNYPGSSTGGIVGFLNNSTLSNAKVENLSINLTEAKYVGGIVGSGKMTNLSTNYNYTNLEIKNSNVKLVLPSQYGDNVGYYSYNQTYAGSIAGNLEKVRVYESKASSVNVRAKSAGGAVGQLDGLLEVGILSNLDVECDSSSYCGAIVAYGNSYYNGGYLDEIVVEANVHNTGYTYGMNVTGYDLKDAKSILADVSLTTSDSYVGFGNKSSGYWRSGTMTASGFNNPTTNYLVYISPNVTKTFNYSIYYVFEANNNKIQMLDDVLDTWIGGDNNGTNYYFDYDTNHEMVLLNTTDNPLTFSMTGSGTQASPYLLRNEQDFKMAALRLNGGYYFKIANDIDFSSFEYYYGLGTYNNYFNGTLDGDNHTLSNLNSELGLFGGIVGYLNGGTVKNIVLDDCTSKDLRVPSNSRSGLLVGNNIDGTINNITATDSTFTSIGVTGTSNPVVIVGGLFGYSDGTISNITASNVTTNTSTFSPGSIYFNSGSMVGTGGIVGYNVGSIQEVNVSGTTTTGGYTTGGVIGVNNGTASKLFATGITVSSSFDTGGFIGENNEDATFTTGIILSSTISGGQYLGGIAGYNEGTLREIEARTTVTTTSFGAAGAVGKTNGNSLIDGVLVEVYASGDQYINGVIGVGGGEVYAVLEAGRIDTTCDWTGEYINSGYTITGIGYANENVLRYYNESTPITGGSGYEYSSNHRLMTIYDDVLDTWIGGDNNNTGYYFDFESDNSNKVILKKVEANTFNFSMTGNGTQASPYLLSTEADFKMAALRLNGNYYFKLANNIDVSTFKHFYPLGSSKNYFNGTLLGDNKVITKLNINGGVNTGLVGYLNGGSVSNIEIDDSNIRGCYNGGNGYLGSAVGYVSSNSSVSNITVHDTTFSNLLDNTGGIVGYTAGTVSTISGHDLTFTGSEVVGGLVGIVSGGTLNTLNITDLSITSSDCGGIVGKSTGTISNLTANNVTLYCSTAGGAVGYNDTTITGANVSNATIRTYPYNEYNYTSYVGGVAGQSSGVVSNAQASYIDINIPGSGICAGGIIGGIYPYTYVSGQSEVNNSTVTNSSITLAGEYVGGIAGFGFGTGNTVSNTNVTGTNYVGGISGKAWGSITNSTVNGSSLITGQEYVGGIVGASGLSYDTFTISDNTSYATVIGTEKVGGIAGNLSYGRLSGNNVRANINGTDRVGGLIGYSYNLISVGNNYTGTVSGNDYVGGVVGYFDSKVTDDLSEHPKVIESAIHGTILGNNYVGGLVGSFYCSRCGNGVTGYDLGFTNNLINAIVTGSTQVAGILGSSSSQDATYENVIENSTITATANDGIAGRFVARSTYFGPINYYSDNSSFNADTLYTGDYETQFGSSYVNDLNYYDDLAGVLTNNKVLESATTGDVNNTGFIFDYDSNNIIKVVKVGASTQQVPPSTQTTLITNQVCTTGDTEPPTCTFHYIVPVTNGIRASFSCTDNSEAPLMASMFNATTSANYSYDDILAPGRGSAKTGTVNGNTRTWTGSWTTTGDPSNPPTPNTCYYYQFAAKDTCGNTRSYVTTSCYQGFASN